MCESVDLFSRTHIEATLNILQNKEYLKKLITKNFYVHNDRRTSHNSDFIHLTLINRMKKNDTQFFSMNNFRNNKESRTLIN